MNTCILSGRIQKNAIASGTEPKVLRFVLETRNTNGDGEKKSSFVPCVLFNPTPEVEALLTSKGEGLAVELEGRVSGPNPENGNSRRFGTEVIVRNRTLTVLTD